VQIPWEFFWRKPSRFPDPDWDAIEELVVADGLDSAWSEIALSWMGMIGVALGPEYRIHSSKNFLVLSSAPSERLREIVLFLEDCHERILESLPFVNRSALYGKVGVVVFANDSDFYEYLDLFQESEDGDYGLVGGVYLNSGYGHFAMPSEKIELYRAVMCHELCHAFLASFGLPAWLDEAITQEIEHKIVGGNPYLLDREIIRRHRNYWDEERLAAFMTGESFWFADDGQELSYHLARYLFNAMASYSTPETMARFIRSVSRDDAGFSAAIEVLDLDLEEVLAGLLDGD